MDLHAILTDLNYATGQLWDRARGGPGDIFRALDALERVEAVVMEHLAQADPCVAAEEGR